MGRLLRNPVLRAVAVALILFAQLQLLWVASVHQHGPLLMPQSATLQSANPAQQPAPVGAKVLCPACHLIHQNAARTSAGLSAHYARISVRCPAVVLSADLHSCDLAVLYGRAPPLA